MTTNTKGFLTTQSGLYVIGRNAVATETEAGTTYAPGKEDTYLMIPPGSINVSIGQNGSVSYTDENPESIVLADVVVAQVGEPPAGRPEDVVYVVSGVAGVLADRLPGVPAGVVVFPRGTRLRVTGDRNVGGRLAITLGPVARLGGGEDDDGSDGVGWGGGSDGEDDGGSDGVGQGGGSGDRGSVVVGGGVVSAGEVGALAAAAEAAEVPEVPGWVYRCGGVDAGGEPSCAGAGGGGGGAGCGGAGGGAG